MAKQPFRRPEEMEGNDIRTPVSARIKLESRKILEEAAKRRKRSLAWLVANILDDYAKWLTVTK